MTKNTHLASGLAISVALLGQQVLNHLLYV